MKNLELYMKSEFIQVVLKADAPLILLEPFDESAYDEKYIMKVWIAILFPFIKNK